MSRKTLAVAKQKKLTRFLQDTQVIDWHQMATSAPLGLVIELGVSGGQSLRHICRYFPDRTCYGFDWFFGLPEDWISKGYVNQPKWKYSTNGIPPAVASNGQIIMGLIEQSLKPFLKEKNQPLSFVHFDMDLYAPTAFALQAMNSYFQDRTILLFDEIAEGPGVEHEERAFREWLDQAQFDIDFVGCDGGPRRAFRLIDA
jgi:hypothetical protein